jgi:hypothetical protein
MEDEAIAFGSSVVVLASLLNLHNFNLCRSQVGWGLGKGGAESTQGTGFKFHVKSDRFLHFLWVDLILCKFDRV